MLKRSNLKEFLKEINDVPDLAILNRASEQKRYSRDFFDYSPILKEKLASCLADCVVKPFTVDAVIAIAKICRKYEIPLTLRGSGTGNYGQCVPLEGGVVMIMTALKNIRNFDMSTGEVTVESGCLLADLNRYLLERGRQLRPKLSKSPNLCVGSRNCGSKRI